MSERTRLEITVYDRIAFTGIFSTCEQAVEFRHWWANHPDLPHGGSVLMRADLRDTWREAHPLKSAQLTTTQGRIIASKLEELGIDSPRRDAGLPARNVALTYTQEQPSDFERALTKEQ